MGDTDDPSTERLSAEAAFSLVSDETRFAILRELQAADDPVAFSDLREAVGVEDPGRFNYHLGELRGQFVAKREDGYEALPPGHRLVGAVLAGSYTGVLDADPVDVDGECIACGGSLVARFRDHGVAIDCTECEAMVTNPAVPAGLLADVDPEDAPEVVSRWNRAQLMAMESGVCQNCYGRLERTLYLTDDPGAPEWVAESDLLGMTYYDCERCGRRFNAAVQIAALSHPRVAAYHHEHGIDVRRTPTWALDWIEVGRGSVESRDPVRIALPIPLGDERRTFVLDGDLDVVEIRRS
ncbi:MAG: winged helix-turn-helix domain-containing protein [Halobacterium sp.]